MNPDKTSVIALFSAPRQYVIPVFQRGYVWTLEKQVAPLWEDIEELATRWMERQETLKKTASSQLAILPKHFLGSIVLAPIANAFNRVTAYEVIDGQQRTTTLHLLLLAFRHAAQKFDDSLVAGTLDSLVKNTGAFSIKSDEHKVWPTQAGRDEISFLDQASNAAAVYEKYPVLKGKARCERPLMIQAYLYLYHAILVYMAGLSMDDPEGDETDRIISDAVIHSVRNHNKEELERSPQPFSTEKAQALYMTLQNAMQIMTLTLESEDDPQVIFETLNARGEPLLASDLIRNFVFLDAVRREMDVNELYESHWKSFDEQRDSNNKVTANRYWRELERSGRITHPRIDLFFFHYTILRRKQETKVAHVFQGFKEWWQEGIKETDKELEQIVTTSGYFKELVSPEGVGYLAEFARLVKVMDVSTLAPTYLFLREHYKVDDPMLKQAINDLASYLVRRAVCGFTTKNYNRIFLRMLELISSQNAGEPAHVVRVYLQGLGGHSQCWPTDSEFREQWLNRPVYKELRASKTAAILRALEVAGRTSWQESEIVLTIDKLTVEHVLPQAWEKTQFYPLGGVTDDLRATRNRLLHTFGNLTLLMQGLNSAVSNGPFEDVVVDDNIRTDGKRTMICGQSLLKMNAYFQGKPTWAEPELTERAEALLNQAIQLWPLPASAETLTI